MFRYLLCSLVWLALLSGASPVAARDEARVVQVDPVVRDGRLYLNADVELELEGDLLEVARKGVPLYFTADAELVVRRRWWFDRVVVREQQTWRVVYNALTRQWRVGTGELLVPEFSLDDALRQVRHIRGWALVDASRLAPDETYHGRIRLRLDTSLLARPFQIDALNSSAWSLATPWRNFTFSISRDEPRP